MGADYEQFHNQLFIALPETPPLHYFFIMTLLCTHSLKGCPISNLLDDLMKASFIFWARPTKCGPKNKILKRHCFMIGMNWGLSFHLFINTVLFCERKKYALSLNMKLLNLWLIFSISKASQEYNPKYNSTLAPYKGGLFSENAICFLHCQIKSLSWTWHLNFPPITVNNLFKFQAQDSDLEYLFWQCEKHNTLSEKKNL